MPRAVTLAVFHSSREVLRYLAPLRRAGHLRVKCLPQSAVVRVPANATGVLWELGPDDEIDRRRLSRVLSGAPAASFGGGARQVSDLSRAVGFRHHLSVPLRLAEVERALGLPGAQDLARASVVHSDHGANAIIQLAGAWTRENLDPLRRCFSAVVRSPGGIRIDFTAVSHADSACIGLLMLLYGYQRSRGAGFSVRGISPQLRRIFELSCAEYMLER